MKKRIKVVYLDYSYIFSGAEMSLKALLSGIDRDAVDARLLFLYPQDYQQGYDELGLPMVYLSSSPKWWMGTDYWKRPIRGTDFLKRILFALRIVLYVKRENIDLVHFNLMKLDCIDYLRVLRLFGIKVVLHGRSYPQWKPTVAIIDNCTAIITVSELVKCYYNEVKADSRIHALHNPIALPDAIPSREEALLRLNLEPEYRYCASIGLLQLFKGHDVAIRVLGQLAADYPDLRLIVAGGGGDLELLKRIAVDERIGDRVLFTERQIPNVADVYACTEFVFSLTKIGEAFGRVPFEGMSYGVPVIAPNLGAAPELIISGDNGLLVDPNGPIEEIEQVVRLILDDSEYRARLVRNGFQLVKEKLSPASYARRVVDIYRTIV